MRPAMRCGDAGSWARRAHLWLDLRRRSGVPAGCRRRRELSSVRRRSDQARDPGFDAIFRSSRGDCRGEPARRGELLLSLNRRDPRFPDLFSLDLASGALDLVEENPGLAGFVTDETYRAVLALKLAPNGARQVLRKVDGAWVPFLEFAPDDARSSGPNHLDPGGGSCICVTRAAATLQPWLGWTCLPARAPFWRPTTCGYRWHDRGYRNADAARIHRGGRANGISRARQDDGAGPGFPRTVGNW